jgi:hypothetical protein
VECCQEGVYAVRRSIGQDTHVANEVDEEEGCLTTGGESKGSELRGYNDRYDIGEKGRGNAVKEEYYEEVAWIVPGGGSLKKLMLVRVE